MTTQTKQTHTPGPWKVSLNQTNIGHTIYGPNNDIIADVTGIHKRGADECMANANLISCAPELLSVLKIMLNAALEPEWDEMPLDILRCAEFVIAKAEGKL